MHESVFIHLKLYGQPIEAKELELKHVDETLFMCNEFVFLFISRLM
jgi:hypothetical protein